MLTKSSYMSGMVLCLQSLATCQEQYCATSKLHNHIHKCMCVNYCSVQRDFVHLTTLHVHVHVCTCMYMYVHVCTCVQLNYNR